MWCCVDCDNFFCSCERVFRPDLVNTPVVVLSNNDGCVIAMSREAKKMGIKMGIPYYQLLEEYPKNNITAFSSNYVLYGDLSARIMSILRKEAPLAYQYSIDEAFLNLSEIENSTLKQWGEELSKKILKWTGLPVSIGIARTKTLAKVAVRYAKKYQGYKKCCCILDEKQRETALEGFATEDVWGIGRRLKASLENYGLTTALQFANAPKSWIRRKYHVTGERTWRELNGEDIIDTVEMNGTRKSILTSRSFPRNINSIEELRTNVSNYAARCSAKLRKQNSVCSMVTVFVQSNPFCKELLQYSGSLTGYFATPTSSTPEIVQKSTELLKKIYHSGIYYKRAGVMVSDLSSATSIQTDLFFYNPEKRKKLDSISKTIDYLNNLLGDDSVILASQQYKETGADGKHLKFSHAIRRSLKSPDYTTRPGDFQVI